MALSGILAALHARHSTDRGQHVDVAMLDVMLFVDEHVQERLAGETELGDPAVLGSGWSPVVEVADGTRVTVAGDPGGVACDRFLALLGRDDLLADPAMRTWAGRRQHGPALRRDFVDLAAGIPTADALVSLLDEVGLAAGVVRSVEEVAATDHVAHRGSIVEVDDRRGGTFAVPQAPWRFSDTPASVAGPPAWRGEHNRLVCAELLGLGDDDVDRLEAEGALVSRPPSGA